MLGVFGYIALGVFMLLLVVIAYGASRNQSSEGFLIAERRLTLLSAVSTINASKTGSIVFIFTAFIYAYGISALWYFIGMSVGYLVFLPFALRIFRKHGKKHYTLPAYFLDNYGKPAAKLAAVCCIIAMFGTMTLNLIAATKVFSFVTEFELATSTLCIAAIVLLYLLLSGFQAVVRTDYLQYGIILALFFLFLGMLYNGPQIPSEDLRVGAAGMQNIISFFLFGVLLPFAQPELWQRVYAMPDEKLLKRSLIISIIVHFVMAVVLAMIGLSIKAALPDLNPDNALMEGLTILLPVGLNALVLIAFFAILMSSIDTYAYTGASNLVQDFLPNLPAEKSVAWIRGALILFIVLGALVTLYLPNLVQAAFIFSGFIILVSVPVVASWIFPKINPLTINITLPLSFIVMTGIILFLSARGELTPLVLLISIGVSALSLVVSVLISLIVRRAGVSAQGALEGR